MKALFTILLLLSLIPPLSRAEDSPLEGKMQILARGLKKLSQQGTDPAKQAENISLLKSLKMAAEEAKLLEPRMTEDISADRKEKFLSDYRAQMDRLAGTFGEIEAAVRAGDYSKVTPLLGTLKSERKEGHDQFKKD